MSFFERNFKIESGKNGAKTNIIWYNISINEAKFLGVMMIKKGTIYKITNKNNGLVYIGQTVQELKRRWRSHKSHLMSHTHHNELLQRVYDKHGFDVFSIELLEECNVKDIDERERYWISYYDSTNHEKGYNFESGGNELKKHSPDTIKKFILHSRGENNKLSPENVIDIKKKIINGYSISSIAKEFHVTIHCIYRIKHLDNWAYIAPELNDDVVHTDTSRKVKRLSDSDFEKCRERILNGDYPYDLSKEYGIDYRRFISMFDDEIRSVKAETKKAKELARDLFFKNYSVDEIIKKTGLTYPQYKRVIRGMEDVRKERNIKYVAKAKAEGKTNYAIAEELHVNRCTISVYIKEYNQKYANTVVNQ